MLYILYSERPYDHSLKSMPALISKIDNVREVTFQLIKLSETQLKVVIPTPIVAPCTRFATLEII